MVDTVVAVIIIEYEVLLLIDFYFLIPLNYRMFRYQIECVGVCVLCLCKMHIVSVQHVHGIMELMVVATRPNHAHD